MPPSIGRYEIVDELHKATNLFLARDLIEDRLVRIRLIVDRASGHFDVMSHFRERVPVLAALEHEAIVPIIDFDIEDSSGYIVTRNMNGGSLWDRTDHRPLSLTELRRILSHIAPALDFAHRQGLVHGFLSPGHILFDAHDNAYIVDIGLEYLIRGSYMSDTEEIATRDYLYSHPDSVTEYRSDIYALGVLLYRTLTNAYPFDQSLSPVEYLFAQINDPVPNILDANPDLPPIFRSIINRALAKNPDDRYPSVADLVADIARAI